MNITHCIPFILMMAGMVSCNRVPKDVPVDLIPEVENITPDYWCTWGAQNYASDTASLRHSLSLGGHSLTADRLSESGVFGEKGWSEAFPASMKKNLILLFDLGWDVPAGTKFENAQWRLGSLNLAEDKFPACLGTPLERLKKLNQLVLESGWKGSGLWLPSHPYGDRKNGKIMPREQVREFYIRALEISREAGIKYWKIDYGFRGEDLEFREMITRLAGEYYPGLFVEHGRGGGPLNDEECPWDTENFYGTGSYRKWDDGSILRKAVQIARISHVFRTYDITQQLSIPTTLDRVAQVLKELSGSGTGTLINCEDEPYIGAVLGCAVGIMRHPNMLEVPGYNYDPFGFKYRMDEVARALNWHRIAPATGAGHSENILDSAMLVDSWKFDPGDGWATWVTGRKVIQVAPARVARGMKLPDVKCGGEPPYVICSKHPTGAVAVGTLPRISSERKIYFPLADVTIQLDDIRNAIGIFGRFKSLTIILPREKKINIDKIFGQDLAGESAIDITDMIELKSGQIVLPGDVIQKIGLSSASPGDLSEPGMLLKIMTMSH